MDSGSFYQFHDSGNKHLLTIANRVNLYLLANDILIDKNRLVDVYLDRILEVVAEHLLVSDYFHSSSAEYKGGSYKDWVAYSLGSLDSALDIGHGLALRIRDIERLDDLVKGVSVFSLFDAYAIGAYYLYASSCQRFGEVYCRLSAEGRDNSLRLLELYYIHNVLNRERLEIELVRRGVIGGDRLGVVVYDYSLVTGVSYGVNSVNGGVIELNALTYSYRT